MNKRKITFFLSGCCCLLALTSCGDDGRVGSSSSATSDPASVGSLMSSHVSSEVSSETHSEGNGILSDVSDMMSSVDDWFSNAESRLESGNVGDAASQ